MALRDVVNRIFRGSRPKAEDTSMPDVRASSGAYMELTKKFASERERAQVIKACRQMYKEDSRVEKMHRTLARDLLGGGPIINVSDNARAQDEAEALQTRLGLNQKLEKYVRLSSRDGDSFLEVAVDDGLDVVSLTRKPTLQMHRASDSRDEFPDPQRAYWMADDQLYMGSDAPKDAIWFSDWQIIHARWQHDEENRYGSPMMASAISAYKRVKEGELDVSVRRKVRAGMVMHHKVKGNAADIAAYQEINKAALDQPFAAMRDLFTNDEGEITAIQGDAHLNEIDDIRHHIATLFTGSDVPMELMAYGEGLNRDILGEKKAEYAEILWQGREWITEQIIQPLLERQWLLKGILPEGLKYSIEWKRTTSVTAQDIQAVVQAAVQMRLLGVREEAIQAMLSNYLPGVDAKTLFSGEGGTGDTERFAQILKGISV